MNNELQIHRPHEQRIIGTLDKNPHTLIPYVETEKGHIQPMQLKIHNPMVKDIPNGTTVVLTTTSAIIHLRSNGEDILDPDKHEWLKTPVQYDELPDRWIGFAGEELKHYLQIYGECTIVPAE